jgi:adenosylcobinamide kinase/adenosylcobinamide-phosphate guanylyltransferase
MSQLVLHPVTLVLGGTRSGKSAHAERLLLQSGLQPVYLATAEARDEEMEARITAHQTRRDEAWITIEEPVELAEYLEQACQRKRAVLVDCLTLWLTNLMMAGRNVTAEITRLTDSLGHLNGPVVLVSGETGLGIIADNATARAFCDYQGELNQAVAARAQQVIFVTAGLPLILKPAS